MPLAQEPQLLRLSVVAIWGRCGGQVDVQRLAALVCSQ